MLNRFVKYYMDQLSLHQVFEKYVPQTVKMHMAPAEALSLMVFSSYKVCYFEATIKELLEVLKKGVKKI